MRVGLSTEGDEIPAVEYTIRQTVSCRFTPKEDITAYELAQLIPFFHGRWMYEEDWDALGAALQRHLSRP